MGSPRYFWAFTLVVIPMVAPAAVLAQSSAGNSASDLGRNDPLARKPIEPSPRKPRRRSRSRISPRLDERTATNDWNPHYLKGKEHFLQGQYAKALPELMHNVADCDQIDFESLRRQNGYFDHIWNNIPALGHNPHAFIRASNLQWVGAVLAARGEYDLAETQFTEMANYAERCFPGRMSTFAGCSCQGLAFLLAARGQYSEAADRYRLALAHIEGNQAQIGLPPAPCVAMILAALADVELARGRAAAAEQCIRRADHVQEAQHQLGIGPAPLDRAAVLTVLAQIRHCQERHSEAYDLYAKALGMIEAIRKEHPLTAYCLDGLAEVDLIRGRLNQSENHFRESLAVRQASLGEGHRQVAYSFDGLARVAAARGQHAEAETLAKNASSILARELGPTHPDLAGPTPRARPSAVQPHPGTKPDHPRARFLALPTFLTVGWQVLYLGKDWRVVEAKILWREHKEAKTVHHQLSVSPDAPATAQNGR